MPLRLRIALDLSSVLVVVALVAVLISGSTSIPSDGNSQFTPQRLAHIDLSNEEHDHPQEPTGEVVHIHLCSSDCPCSSSETGKVVALVRSQEPEVDFFVVFPDEKQLPEEYFEYPSFTATHAGPIEHSGATVKGPVTAMAVRGR